MSTGLPRSVQVRLVRPETAIAEKLHAMVELDAKNSRMRDFFDVHALAARESFDGAALAEAIAATFARRRTAMPRDLPLALTPAFAALEGKAAQWSGFVRRLPRTSAPGDLVSVVDGVARFAGPVLTAPARGVRFAQRWEPGGPWSTT